MLIFVDHLAADEDKMDHFLKWLKSQMERIECIFKNKLLGRSERNTKLEELYTKTTETTVEILSST